MTDWYGSTASSALTVRVGSGGAIETNPDPSDSGNTWTAQVSGTAENLYGVAYNGVGFVAVGATGIGLYSTDGVVWVGVTTQSVEDLNAVAAGGNVFIAVGNGGTMVQSQNGTVWTVITSGVTDDLWDVAIGNAVYVAVGDNDAVVTGDVTSTVLEVHLVETVLSAASLTDTGAFNTTVVDGLLADEAATRTLDIADDVVRQFFNETTTFGNNITHELNGADPQTGVDDSIVGTSSPVITEGLNLTENNSLILGGAGTGEPHYVTHTEAVLMAQLGNFDDAILNAVTLDSAGMSDRIFDSFEKIQEVVNITDANLAQYHKLVADAFAVDDTAVANMLFSFITNETVGMDDAPSTSGIFIAVAEDQVTINEALTTSQIFELLVNEDLNALAGFTLREDGSYIGVAMNTKNYAVTEYQDFDFNSLAKIGSQYYGCKSDGIYLLGGSSDAGTAIAAVVKSGQRKLGQNYSRVERAYLAMRNSGSLVLKTIVRDRDGVKKERWYETDNTSDTIRDIRIKLAKGVKAHYWQWELVNDDGADFELDSLELKEIKLTRRI